MSLSATPRDVLCVLLPQRFIKPFHIRPNHLHKILQFACSVHTKELIKHVNVILDQDSLLTRGFVQTTMPSRQGNSRRGRGNDSSQTNSSLNESHKDGFDSPYKDARPRWRRLLTSRICWIIAATVMLLLGLVLGLSIGLTRSSGILPDNEPGAPQPHLPQPGQQLGAVVDLGYTKYQGDTYPGGISQWLGLRYAQPPVGHLRFAAPQSITGNGNLEMATEVRQIFPSHILCLANI